MSVVRHFQTVATGLQRLLQPWPSLTLGLVVLSLAQGWSAQATGAEYVQLLAGDALLLPRAVLLWCLLTWPVLFLPERWRCWVQGALGSLLLLMAAALDLYFSVAGVPLGADLLAYSWLELRTTVSGAQLHVPMVSVLALALAWLVLWGPLWWLLNRAQMVFSGRMALGLVALSLASSLMLPSRLANASALATHKLPFFVEDLLLRQVPATAGLSDAHPFEHAETTPDTLGPLLDLDAAKAPNLVMVVVEGLGRSFSGPGAPLGSFTPFLDELAQKSLYWDNFLATQGRTFAVLPSVLGSLPFGPYGAQSMAHDDLLSLLKRQGYSLRYFSGSNLAFDHQGDFLAGSGVQTFWSEQDFAAPARKLSEWGYPDGDLMRTVLSQPMPPAPSLTLVQTMSMHSPFVLPQPELYRQKVEARLDALSIPQAQRAPYRKQQDVYASILYTDEALKVFFDQAMHRPEWRNTVFVITGDHRLPEIPMATRLERYHVPLIVYSPMLRTPKHIKALSSHVDIAPTLLAMLSHRYGWPMPQRVHWMGTGLDTHPQWRNLHTVALKQTKTELSDYVSGAYYLAQDKLYSLQDGLVATPEENATLAQNLRTEFNALKARLSRLAQGGELVSSAGREDRQVYAEAGRSLEPVVRARQVQGVVVSGLQAQFDAEGRLQARGLFHQQGPEPSPVFVPLLVLSDATGRDLAEASAPAVRLASGQSEQIELSLKPTALPAGTYYLSMLVSHPDTGRSIGKGQYHVEIRR